jgi:predicted  nucleic acid-binding Zn-ribbon protein
LLLSGALCSFAQSPSPSLHDRIDQVVDASGSGVSAPAVSDAEFLRRVSLDLIGVPPTKEELRQFLADGSVTKRASAIDRLLASSLFARHLANVLDTFLMERRAASAVSQDEWHSYLEESIRQEKPLNVLFREILAADGVDPARRAAARFYLDRGGEANLITRDVGRIFFGRDWQCAQCHDSPLVDDYHQSDYKGLFAFFEGGVVVTRKEGDKDKTYYGERASGDLSFESVFVKGKKHVTSARVPASVAMVEPIFHPGEEYTTPPADGVVPIAKFIRRQQLAEQATSGANRWFNENLANRLWAHMMGRGLVHPVDMHHSSNPASYPEVLTMLGAELAAMNFPLKGFLRELALTRVYQRSIDFPSSLAERASAAANRLAKLDQDRPALAARLEEKQKSYEQLKEKYQQAEAALLPVAEELAAARSKVAEIDKKVAEARKQLADAQGNVDRRKGAQAALGEAIAKAQAVAAQLPEDKELSASAAKLAEQLARLTSELPAHEKAVTDKVPAVDAALVELAAVKAQMDGVVARWQPLREPVRVVDAEVVAARMAMMDAVAELGRHDQRIGLIKTFVEFKQAEEARAASTAQVVSAQSSMATAREEMADQAMSIARMQIDVAQADDQVVQAQAAVARLEMDRKTADESSRLLAEAFALVESAKQSMVSDPRLEPMISMLEAKSTEARTAIQTVSAQSAEAANQLVSAQQRAGATRQDLARLLEENVKRFQGAQSVRTTLEQALATAGQTESAAGQVEGKLQSEWSSDLTLAALKPLTPEQICWGILRITGIEDRYKQQERAELDKSAPLSEEAKKDPAQVAQREFEIEKRSYEKLKSAVGGFVAYFAAASGQPQSDFFATADQALFVSNDGTVNSWIAPAAGNVTERIIAQVDARAAAEDLYLTVLSRRPSEQEITDVAEHLNRRSTEKSAAAQELVWGLVTSAEFRFNH